MPSFMNNGGESCGDVLMIPTALKGHIDPMIYVGRGLLKYGLRTTVVIQEDLRGLLDTVIQEKTEGLTIHLVPSLNDESRFPIWAAENSKRAIEPFFRKLRAEQLAGAQGFKCMIADMFQGWTQAWADELHLPRYVLCPSPATFGLVMNNFSSLMAEGLLDGDEKDPEIRVRGAPLMHLSDLPPMVPKSPSFMYESGDTFKESAGMLFNTFYELEARAIDAFQARVEATCNREKVFRMFPLGPMLPLEFLSHEAYVGTYKDSETMQWLNTRPESSVLYVAFGSMAYLNPTEIMELAHGLETSEVSFLWVLRVRSSNGQSADFSTFLPAGFQARTAGRGLIYTGFAPQLQILSHKAIFGFLTHCGWNSCLESICRGVPMLAWPMSAEQGLNCRLLVDEARVATQIKKAADGCLRREEVEKGVRLLMRDSTEKRLKERVSALQRRAREAVASGGSSYNNLEILVEDIKSTKMLQAQ